MNPTPLIGSAISATSMSQPFGVYGPQQASGTQQYAPTAAGGGGSAGGGSVAGGIGYLGSAVLAGFNGLGSRGGASASGSTAADIQSIQGAPSNMLGNIQKGVGLASMANRALGSNGSAGLGGALGAVGGGLQFINGMKQGGIMGYGSAAVGGLRAASGIAGLMGNAGMAGTLGAAAGYIAAPLAVYSAIKNWKSGSTGMDALQGAEAGAAVGSMIVPGIGTVVGAVIGGAVGAVSSAFGGGKTSTEQTQDRGMDAALQGATSDQRAQAISTLSPAQNIQSINGFMNAHNTSAGHDESIQNAFGKNGVSNMFSQMMPQINSAIAKDPSLAKLSASELYSKVVTPWLKSKGATISGDSNDVKGNNEGSNLQDSITAAIGQWQAGAFTSKTPVGVGGQTINIPAYGPNG